MGGRRIGEAKCLLALLDAGIPAFALNAGKSDGGIDIFGYYVNLGFNIQVKFVSQYDKSRYEKDLKKFWKVMKKYPENIGFFVYFSDKNVHDLRFEVKPSYNSISYMTYQSISFNYDKFKNEYGIKNIYNVMQRLEFNYFDGNFKRIHFIVYDSTQGSFYNGTRQEIQLNFLE
ncbi:4304_t:CDS:2, partial [Dentiscutata erythropus]